MVAAAAAVRRALVRAMCCGRVPAVAGHLALRDCLQHERERFCATRLCGSAAHMVCAPGTVRSCHFETAFVGVYAPPSGCPDRRPL